MASLLSSGVPFLLPPDPILKDIFATIQVFPRQELPIYAHMGSEYVSREKKFTMVNFLIFVQKNVSTIRFQEIKIRPLKGFEKMRFLCFYIIGVKGYFGPKYP